MACYSFYPGKNLGACGEGGGITTNNEKIKEHLCSLRNHGCKERYYHDEIGYNYRLTNLHAAIGVSQIDRLPSFVKYKKIIHQKYVSELNHISGLNIVSTPDYSNNNYWLNILQIELLIADF